MSEVSTSLKRKADESSLEDTAKKLQSHGAETERKSPRFEDFLTGDHVTDYGEESKDCIPLPTSKTAMRYLEALSKYVLIDDVKIPPQTCAALLACNPMLRFMPEVGYNFGGNRLISECENALYTTVRRSTNGIRARLNSQELAEYGNRLLSIVKRHAVCFLTYAKLFGDEETAKCILEVASKKPLHTIHPDKSKDKNGMELDFISTNLHFVFAYRVACELVSAHSEIKPIIATLKTLAISHYKTSKQLDNLQEDQKLVRNMRGDANFWANSGPNGYLSALNQVHEP